MDVCVCVCAKGIHFQLFHHTSRSTDMLVCLSLCICVQVFCFFYPHSRFVTKHTHTHQGPDRSFFFLISTIGRSHDAPV